MIFLFKIYISKILEIILLIMESASKFGLNYGLNYSESENISDCDESGKKIKTRSADLNIFSFGFKELLNLKNIHQHQQIIKCSRCGAIYSSISKEVTLQDNMYEKKNESKNFKKIWQCEYCYNENNLENFESNKILDEATFCLDVDSAASENNTEKINEPKISQDLMTLFCIDISDSMGFQIKHNSVISKLSAIKTACIECLTEIKTKHPNERVGLLTFGSDVIFYGDCTQSKIEKLNINLKSKDELIECAHKNKTKLKPLNETFTNIINQIKMLITNGSTALGPAVAYSIGFSSTEAGSQIILCTDGCANIGIGSIDKTGAGQFYDQISLYSKYVGVKVNVISLFGDDAKIAYIGKLAANTNGYINIVDPDNLAIEIQSIFKNRVIATNVKVKFIVNSKYMYIRDDNYTKLEIIASRLRNIKKRRILLDTEKTSVFENEIGTVNEDTGITFEYGIRSVPNEYSNISFTELPFQLQITFRGLNGRNLLKVYSKMLPFTRDRVTSELSFTNQNIIFKHSLRKMSILIQENEMTEAINYAKSIEYLKCRMNIESPEIYNEKQSVIKSLIKQKRFCDLNDDTAKNVYQSFNMSLNNMI